MRLLEANQAHTCPTPLLALALWLQDFDTCTCGACTQGDCMCIGGTCKCVVGGRGGRCGRWHARDTLRCC